MHHKTIQCLQLYLIHLYMILVFRMQLLQIMRELKQIKFAEKIHRTLAKGLNNASACSKKIIRQLFVQKRCIPTKLGMKFPNEAYLQTVNLFPDLPTIQFQRPLSVQNLMELFGVRKVNF